MTRAFNTELRYGIHKETQKKLEAFMLFPKEQHWIDMVKANIQEFPVPNQRRIGKLKSKHPDLGAMMSGCRSNVVISYAPPGFIEYRKSIYAYHIYQFIRNDHTKIEITAYFDPKKRSKERVLHEVEQVLDKVTFGVKYTEYFHHSLGN